MTSPSGLGLDTTTILSTSLEGILYGISLVLFCGAMWALTHRSSEDGTNWSMVLVALALTILSTVHLVVDIRRLVDGFITNAETFPGGPPGFFADVAQITFVVKNATYVLQTLLGDGVVIYRCYVVWQRSEFIMLPVVLWCASLATSAGFLYSSSHIKNPGDVLLPDIGEFPVLFYLLTLVTNVLSSALLAYGIWESNRDVPGVVRVLSRRAIEGKLLFRILIDSAALYTLTLFVLLVCFAYQSPGQLIVLDMITPIISITFHTILVRIAIAKSRALRSPSAALSPVRFATRFAPSPSDLMFTRARRSSI